MPKTLNVKVPKAWSRILAAVLKAQTSDPDLSAKRFIVQHKADKQLINRLADMRLIKLDPHKDKISVHLYALFLINNEQANEKIEEVESLYATLRDHYEEHLDTPISLEKLAASSHINASRIIHCVQLLLDMPGFSRDLSSHTPWIQPSDVILDFKNVSDFVQKEAIHWFSELKENKANSNSASEPGNKKSTRRKRITELLQEIDRRTRANQSLWDSASIPVQRKYFYDLFYQINPDISKVTEGTFDKDLIACGAKFNPGTRYHSGEELRVLFKKELKDIKS